MQTAKKAIPYVLFLIISCVPVGQVSVCRANEAVDHSIFNELLMKYVKDDVVDYQGFKKCESRLDSYLIVLEKTDTKVLSRNERFAFYINAYNAWTIKLILGKYPGVKSIKDLGSIFRSPWKKKICRIDGDVLTLDHIEHEILRPGFKDPRVHFAINCAARSCPPLQSEAYLGNRLDIQLQASTEGFINNSTHNYLKGNTLYVSKIFEWFGDDFNGEIVEFFLKHARGELKEKLQAGKGNITVKYLDYDWSLNGKTYIVDRTGERWDVSQAGSIGFNPERFQYGIGRNTIPPLDDSHFGVGPYRVPEDLRVIGVAEGKTAQAYSVPKLTRHEIANTEIGGKKIAVGY